MMCISYKDISTIKLTISVANGFVDIVKLILSSGDTQYFYNVLLLYLHIGKVILTFNHNYIDEK